jgi:hypothetical protein
MREGETVMAELLSDEYELLATKLFSYKNIDVQMQAVENDRIPEELLYEAAKDEKLCGRVLAAVARHPNASHRVLRLLATRDCYDPLVKAAVAQNPNCPRDILDMLAKDKREEVRIATAKNPHTLPSTLEMLADDESIPVRQCVALNPVLPTSTLERLMQDDSDDVRRCAEFAFNRQVTFKSHQP